MKRTLHLVVGVMFLGLLFAVGVPTAQAQVIFEEETHFRCYIVSEQTPQEAVTVTLTDQFLADVTLTLDEPLQFCNPTTKVRDGVTTPILAPEEHLTMYGAHQEILTPLLVETEDQFGPRTLEVVGARVVLVPTEKNQGGVPTALNHYWCYQADGERVRERVDLEDQFRMDTVRVERPKLFCNPVVKTRDGVATPIVEADVHVTCYEIHGPQGPKPDPFDISNQIEEDTFNVTAFELLCVPSAKGAVTPIPPL
jgi:hypothetical protein